MARAMTGRVLMLCATMVPDRELQGGPGRPPYRPGPAPWRASSAVARGHRVGRPCGRSAERGRHPVLRPGTGRRGRGARRRSPARRGGVRGPPSRPAGCWSCPIAAHALEQLVLHATDAAHPGGGGRRRHADVAGRLRRPPGRRARRRAAPLGDHRRGAGPRPRARRAALRAGARLARGSPERGHAAAQRGGVRRPRRAVPDASRRRPSAPAAIKASAGAVEHLLLVPLDDLAGGLVDLRTPRAAARGCRRERIARVPRGGPAGTARARRGQRGSRHLGADPAAHRPRRAHPDARQGRVAQRRGRGLGAAVRGGRAATRRRTPASSERHGHGRAACAEPDADPPVLEPARTTEPCPRRRSGRRGVRRASPMRPTRPPSGRRRARARRTRPVPRPARSLPRPTGARDPVRAEPVARHADGRGSRPAEMPQACPPRTSSG